jgi:hypothetical protein
MHSKTSKLQLAIKEWNQQRKENPSKTDFVVLQDLRQVANDLHIWHEGHNSIGSLLDLIFNAPAFLDLTEKDIEAMVIGGRAEKMLIEAHKRAKKLNYSFIKDLEGI